MSKRWRSLKNEIEVLRAQFLPDPFDVLGQYEGPDRVQAFTRAFLVLSHAEIETFLEEWAKEIARACEIVWRSSGRVTKPLAFLLATHADRMEVPIRLVGADAKDSPNRFSELVVRLFQTYYKEVKDNHGIKEKNVLAMFSPLGVPSEALGTTLLPNLQTLGSLRGQYAHQSGKSVQSVLDPETEYKRIAYVLEELRQLDEWLIDCRRRIR